MLKLDCRRIVLLIKRVILRDAKGTDGLIGRVLGRESSRIVVGEILMTSVSADLGICVVPSA